jgi:hypothetical protein
LPVRQPLDRPKPSIDGASLARPRVGTLRHAVVEPAKRHAVEGHNVHRRDVRLDQIIDGADAIPSFARRKCANYRPRCRRIDRSSRRRLASDLG